MKSIKLTSREWALIGQAAQAALGGILIGVMIYASWQLGSAYIRGYEFEQSARKEASLAAADSRPADTVRGEMLEKAQQLGFVVSWDDIKVASADKQAQIPVAAMAAVVENGDPNALPTVRAVSIDVAYEVPIVFPLHTLELKFHLHADDHSI
jgi:hypothetical protein